MIIINYNDSDPTAYLVIDWLHYLNFDFKIINQNQTFFEFKSVSISNNNIDFNLFKEFNYSNIVYWNRRSFPLFYKFKIHALSDGNKQKLNEFISTEFKFVNQAVNLHFENENSLNKYADNDTNKINNLILAVECNLKIPSTIITNQKNVLLDFVKQKTKVITKAIDNKNFFNTKTEGSGLSTLISENDLIDLPDLFVPSLFQEYISKKIEIRSFFLKNKFFSMAIFSQNDKLTNIDYRNYNYSKPNRTVPFQLPNFVEIKLKRLMKKIGLNTGSIDLIIDKNNEYLFLEVNPVGMFGQLSWPLNMQIEKEIATYLNNPNDYK